jgi:hypothetical protein
MTNPPHRLDRTRGTLFIPVGPHVVMRGNPLGRRKSGTAIPGG